MCDSSKGQSSHLMAGKVADIVLQLPLFTLKSPPATKLQRTLGKCFPSKDHLEIAGIIFRSCHTRANFAWLTSTMPYKAHTALDEHLPTHIHSSATPRLRYSAHRIRNGFVKPGTYIRSFSTITRHYFCVVSTTSEQHCRGLWRPAAIRLLFWILAVFGPSSKSARQHIPLSLSDSSLSDPVRVTKKHAAHGAHYQLSKNTPPEQRSLRQYMSTPLHLNLICSFTVSPCFYLVKISSLTVLSLRTDILRTTEGETQRRDVSPRLLRSTTISILPLISGWSAHHRDRRRRAWSSRTTCLRGASVRA